METYTAPQYHTPYHVSTYSHLMRELTIACNRYPDDEYYHRLWSIMCGCNPDVNGFIDKLSIDINARMANKKLFPNDEEYIRECWRLISEHTRWIARCKQISDDLMEIDEFYGV